MRLLPLQGTGREQLLAQRLMRLHCLAKAEEIHV